MKLPPPLRSVLVLLLATAWVGAAPPTTPNPSEDEKLLAHAKVVTDGPSLLAFFRTRTPTGEQRTRVHGLLRQLGEDSFAVRRQAVADLVALGPAAVPQLRAVVRDASTDAEVRHLAAECVGRLDAGGSVTTRAVARLLLARRPAGAVAALLGYTPFVEDAEVEFEVLAVLSQLVVGPQGVDPLLVRALADAEPGRRASAALLVGRFGTPEQQATVRERFADRESAVRLRAAQGLLAAHDTRAIPVLVALTGDAADPVAEAAHDLLSRLGTPTIAPAPLGKKSSLRQRRRLAWESWWQTHHLLDLRRADVELPWLDPDRRALDVARRFCQAIARKDVAARVRLVRLPFYLTGNGNLQTLEEVNSQFAHLENADPPPVFTLLKPLSLADHLASVVVGDDRSAFEGASPLAWRAVPIVGRVHGSSHKASLLVHFTTTRAVVAGFSMGVVSAR